MNPEAILSGQNGIEGIWWAVQGQTVRRKLRDAIASLLIKPTGLGPFQLQRTKYKPGSRLTAYYDVSLTTPTGQQTDHRLIEVDWRPDNHNGYPSKPNGGFELRMEEMQNQAIQSGIAVPFIKLSTDLPSLGIHIQAYPLDADFPQLVRLSDPVYVKNILEKNGLVIMDGVNQPSDANVTIIPIRYRPGERHVLRIDWILKDPAGVNTKTFFAKLYNIKGDGERRMRVSNQVADWLDELDAGITSARPAAFLADDETLLYPMVPGVALSQLLRHPGNNVAKFLTLAGTAVFTLHSSPNMLTNDLPPKTLESEVKVVHRAAQHVNVLLPDVGEKIKRNLDLILELHNQLPHEPPTFTHSDFKADHLRVSGNQLTLIDFDTCSLADPASDVGKFLADIRFWYEVYGRTDVEDAQRQFLTGYGLPSSDARMLRASLYEALILIKITIRRVPLSDRQWADRTARLVDCADQLLTTLKAQIVSIH